MTNRHRFLAPAPPQKAEVVAKTLKYREHEEHLLRRIASAIVLHWDQLPDDLQDLIIDQAAAVEDRDPAPHEARDIEAFVRNVRTAAVGKTATPPAN